jgi:thioredoxin-related protein
MSRGADRRRFLLLAPALGLAWAAGAADATPIPLATDLAADGRLSRERKAPLVVLFSLPGCPYCEIVRRSHLAPMLRDPSQSGRVIIRQVDIDSDRAVTGFSGEPTTHAAIARAQGVRAAPVVAFWDGEGKPVADPLTGMLLPDFYSAYLDSAIDTARSRLAARR